jgi:hypothetical protein
MLLGVGSWRVRGMCVALVAVPPCAAGCAAALGIDQPNVVGDDAGNDGSTADIASMADASDATSDGGASDGVADSRADSSADAAPGADAPFDAGDGSRDSSAGDASSDAPSDATDAATGPVACATAGVLLCDDFENGLDMTKWPQVDQTNGTTVVDTTMAHRGTHALHLTSNVVTAGPIDIATSLEHFAVFPQTVYVRLFLALSSGLSSAWPTFVVAQQSHSPYLGLQLELADTAGDLGLTDWASTPNFNRTSTTKFTMGWQCVEWQIVQPLNDAGMGQIDVWLDGSEVPALHVSSLPVPDLGDLGVGMSFFQAGVQPSYQMWIDDVFVDTAPVGCAK